MAFVDPNTTFEQESKISWCVIEAQVHVDTIGGLFPRKNFAGVDSNLAEKSTKGRFYTESTTRLRGALNEFGLRESASLVQFVSTPATTVKNASAEASGSVNAGFTEAVQSAMTEFERLGATEDAARQQLSSLHKAFPSAMKTYSSLVGQTSFSNILKKVSQDSSPSKPAPVSSNTPAAPARNALDDYPLKPGMSAEDIKENFARDLRAGWKATSVLELKNVHANHDGVLDLQEFGFNQAAIDLREEFSRISKSRADQGQPPMGSDTKMNLIEKHAATEKSLKKSEEGLKRIHSRLPDGDVDDKAWNLEGAAAQFLEGLKRKYGPDLVDSYSPKNKKTAMELIISIEERVNGS